MVRFPYPHPLSLSEPIRLPCDFSTIVLFGTTCGPYFIVLIEKPLTPTSAEAAQLVDLAKSKNLILAPFQNRRWDADFLAVKGLLKENKVRTPPAPGCSTGRRKEERKLITAPFIWDPEQLGQLLEFTSHFNRFRPQPVLNTWKEAPGQLNDAIYNLGSHLVDQALVLFGKPEKVGGWCYNLRAPEGLNDSVSLAIFCLFCVRGLGLSG